MEFAVKKCPTVIKYKLLDGKKKEIKYTRTAISLTPSLPRNKYKTFLQAA